jgi:hypothetical protein
MYIYTPFTYQAETKEKAVGNLEMVSVLGEVLGYRTTGELLSDMARGELFDYSGKGEMTKTSVKGEVRKYA